MKNIKIMSGVSFLLFLLVINILNAHPPLPTEFYGTIVSFNANATSGTVVAYAGNMSCGSFIVVNGGLYGVLSCNGDDLETAGIEGVAGAENITFRYNSQATTMFGDGLFESGQFKQVNLVHPVVFCGDNFCDLLENCASCESDCRSCNVTGGSGNGSGGSGGGGGGSGGGGGGGDYSYTGEPPSGYVDCVENWVCLNWTECAILGLQTRTCYDENNCGSYTNKPLEVQSCNYEGSCFDSLINCHNDNCEDGIDCGGPCLKKCSIVEQVLKNVTITVPKFTIPNKVCERHIQFRDPGLWIYILLIAASYAVRYLYSQRKIQKLKKDENISALDRSRIIFSTKRKNMLFLITLFFLTIVSLLYSYYFILCPNIFFEYSWILILMIILIPLVVHAIMRRYEYDVGEGHEKERYLEDIHYQHVMRMIQLENDMLADEENTIANKFYELSKRKDFNSIVEKHPSIRDIYKNLTELYSKYKEQKNPYDLEQSFVDEIGVLNNDASFKSEIQSNHELLNIFDRLHRLSVQYEEKKKLYEKLEEVKEVKEAKDEKNAQKDDEEKSSDKSSSK